MKSSHTLIAGVIGGVALVLAVATYAQPYGGMGPGFGPHMGMGGPGSAMGARPGMGPMGGGDPAAMMESRLGYLKAQLKITTAQESAWQAFADQAKQQAAGMQAFHAQMQADGTTAPQRMALHTAVMQQRAAAMTAMSTSFNQLYAVLTPEQKVIADQNFGMMGPRGMRFGQRPS